MASDKPVWCLDIDGVINAERPGWGAPPRKASAAGLTVRWAPDLITRIRAVHDAGSADVRWSTTWCGYPDQLAELGTLLDLDLEPAFGDRPMSKTWADLKAEAALDVLATGRRLIWTDDSEVEAARSLFPVFADAEAAGAALLIDPHFRNGLQPEDLDRIEAFLKEEA